MEDMAEYLYKQIDNLKDEIEKLKNESSAQFTVYHVIYDGNKGGDWWTVYSAGSGRKIGGGVQFLRDLRKPPYHKIGPLHQGCFPGNQSLLGEFYSDTVRWFIGRYNG